MHEDQTDLPELPTTPDASLAFIKEREAYWKARIDPIDTHQSARRRMVNLISDVLDLLDRMNVQAISTPADRAFFRASGDNHYAENLPLQGELEATFTRVIDAETRGEAVPEVPAVQRRPRAYTRQEVQLQIAQYLAFMVRYRHELPVEDPIGNTAFSILTMLDGGPVSLPAFSVHVPGGPDLAGTLHERYADLERASEDETPPPADT